MFRPLTALSLISFSGPAVSQSRQPVAKHPHTDIVRKFFFSGHPKLAGAGFEARNPLKRGLLSTRWESGFKKTSMEIKTIRSNMTTPTPCNLLVFIVVAF